MRKSAALDEANAAAVQAQLFMNPETMRNLENCNSAEYLPPLS